MAMDSVKDVKRRVRVSKNKKKSWNKYCDVKEVEEYLEEKRFEERIGGAVSEKSNAELFFVQNCSVEQAEVKKIKKPLKCFQNIGIFSKVPAPVNSNVKRYTKKIQKRLDNVLERKCKEILSKNSRDKSDLQETTKSGLLFHGELCDLWENGPKKVDPEIEDLVMYKDEITRKRTPNVPAHRYQKPSLLPSVEIPHAGASYNPSYEDHQKLLSEATKIEEKKEKEELHLKRVLTDMFPTKEEAPTAESILQEMSQGLFDDSEPENENSVAFHTLTRNPPVSAEDRLPKSRKRKRKEMKEQARKRALDKLNKKRLDDIYRIRSIKSELNRKLEVTKKRQEKKCERQIEKMYKPRTLSKYKYESPDLEVNLSEELCGSLRTLKSEGNLLEDRYKSLQRRNLIEPRLKQKRKRKYKLKVQVKRSHRNFK